MTILSPERAGLTTGSSLAAIFGSPGEQFEQWEIDTGLKPPRDLSRVFAAQAGKALGPVILDHIELIDQIEITERETFIKHPWREGYGVTLDGYAPALGAVMEAKALGAFASAKTVGNDIGFIDRYSPQVLLQMECRQVERGFLCVAIGNDHVTKFPIEPTNEYRAEFWRRLERYRHCVLTKTPPSPPPAPLVMAEAWRSYDLSEPVLPNWAHALKPLLDTWHDTRVIAKTHDQAKLDVKALLPADVGRVVHGAIQIRRSRNGAVTIVEDQG